MLVCRPAPRDVAFVAVAVAVAVAVDDQVNDHAYVNDHAFRAVLLQALPSGCPAPAPSAADGGG